MSNLQMADYQITIDNIPINFRVFSHKNRVPNDNPRILIHIHGGGWVYGDLEFYTPTCFRYAYFFNAIVISVDYRKAPEFKFPVPFTDCLKFTQWVLQNKTVFGAADTPIYLIGESAGGNLAAAVSLYLIHHQEKMAKMGIDNQIKGQILMYPGLDCSSNYHSVEKYKVNHLLTKEALEFFIDAYTEFPEDRENCYCAPLKAKNFTGYPPTIVITGSHDILRDQGFNFYEKLVQNGIQAFYRNYLLALHGFLNTPALFFRGDEMFENFIHYVKEHMFEDK